MNALDTLQHHLEGALRRTSPADDRDLAARIRDEGRRAVFLLGGLVRAARLYSGENDALTGPSEELAEVAAGLVERLGAVRVVLVEEQAYVNDVRLRVRASEQGVIDQLAAELARHGVGGLTIHRRLSPAALRRLARSLSAAADGPQPLAALRTALAGVGDIEISGPWRFRTGVEEADRPRSHAEVVASAGSALRDTLGRLATGWMPNPLRVRRAVIATVESLRARPDRAALAPFAGLPGTSERHLLSVCQLALMLGRALGLQDPILGDLGVAAVLHDVGYLTERDAARHALAGACLLLRQRGFGEAKIRRLRAVLEHHEDAGACQATGPSLFARIVHVADDYDLLVAPREAPTAFVSPAAALARLWSGRGTRYDPTLVALFARELGLYPPGTLVELSDGRQALVVRANHGRESFALPVVCATPRGGLPDGESVEEIDLGALHGELAIVRAVEPADAAPRALEACRTRLAALAA